MATPIDIQKIKIVGGSIPEFVVKGRQSISALMAQDETAAINFSQRVHIGLANTPTHIAVSLDVTCEAVAGNPAEPVGVGGNFTVDIVFEVENLTDLLQMIDQHPRPIPDMQLATLLISIAYSTARGMLWTRVAGTPLEGFTLPIVDVMQLIKDSAAAEAEEMNAVKN
ncbi:hypothetical protein [Hymenobacter crusticola]|uniref:Uncharacterized protein n=1 Tax=Hymenobacter crusticola TaxID=1770526 RepID=A0A243W8U1_9BACT|nr:hypothetical protein [Hymenobacter crusticola]OUJ69939.1 hypothetical protein BXP70_25700 [Hymenobacter crusticola]